jgi:hypothetical protein
MHKFECVPHLPACTSRLSRSSTPQVVVLAVCWFNPWLARSSPAAAACTLSPTANIHIRTRDLHCGWLNDWLLAYLASGWCKIHLFRCLHLYWCISFRKLHALTRYSWPQSVCLCGEMHYLICGNVREQFLPRHRRALFNSLLKDGFMNLIKLGDCNHWQRKCASGNAFMTYIILIRNK